MPHLWISRRLLLRAAAALPLTGAAQACPIPVCERPVEPTEGTLASDRDGVALQGMDWLVIEADGERTAGGVHVGLTFRADGTLTGDTGCNRIRADFRQDGPQLRVGAVMATRRACTDAAATQWERALIATLQDATRIRVGAGHTDWLILETGEGRRIRPAPRSLSRRRG